MGGAFSFGKDRSRSRTGPISPESLQHVQGLLSGIQQGGARIRGINAPTVSAGFIGGHPQFSNSRFANIKPTAPQPSPRGVGDGAAQGVISNFLGGISQRVGSPNIPSDEALFNRASNRLLQAQRSSRAGTGLLSSGPQLRTENEALSDLATSFGEREFERGLDRARFDQSEESRLFSEGASRAGFGQSELSRLFGEDLEDRRFGQSEAERVFGQQLSSAQFQAAQEAQAMQGLIAALQSILGQSTTGSSSSSGLRFGASGGAGSLGGFG